MSVEDVVTAVDFERRQGKTSRAALSDEVPTAV